MGADLRVPSFAGYHLYCQAAGSTALSGVFAGVEVLRLGAGCGFISRGFPLTSLLNLPSLQPRFFRQFALQ